MIFGDQWPGFLEKKNHMSSLDQTWSAQLFWNKILNISMQLLNMKYSNYHISILL